MQYRCNSDAIRCIIDIIKMQLGKKLRIYKSCLLLSRVVGWVGGVDKLRIKLSQLSTWLKLKLKLSLAIVASVKLKIVA